MTWMGNYERLNGPARFVPAKDAAAEWVWPTRGFRADSYGGSGVDCLGSRYDVLARDNPSWAGEVLSAAVAAEMPLRAVRIGSAGKYRFWRLLATSPAEAEAEGRAEKARFVAAMAEKQNAKDRAKARAVAPNELVYRTMDEEPVPAVAVILGVSWATAGPNVVATWWDADGVRHDEGLDGLRLIQADGRIRAARDQRRSSWDYL